MHFEMFQHSIGVSMQNVHCKSSVIQQTSACIVVDTKTNLVCIRCICAIFCHEKTQTNCNIEMCAKPLWNFLISILCSGSLAILMKWSENIFQKYSLNIHFSRDRHTIVSMCACIGMIANCRLNKHSLNFDKLYK